MKRNMRNIVITICILALSLSSIIALSSCSSDGEIDFTLASDRLWLTLYEEKELEFVKGDGSDITYTVKDTNVVTVENGKFIAQGEGETQVTLKNKSGEVSITVMVRDDGTLPEIALREETEVCAYKDVETALPLYIAYGDAEYEIGDYTLSVASTSSEYLAVSGNKIIGLKLTEEGQSARITVSCTYKGLELEQTYKIAVKEGSYIEFGKESLDVYNGDTTLKSYAIVPQEAVYKAQPIAAADLTAEVVDGKDKIEIFKDPDTGINKILAKASEGRATVKVSYAAPDGGSVETTLNVVLHPAYIETEFVLSDITKGSVYEDVADTSGIFEGRTGVKKYIADPVARVELLNSDIVLNRQNLQISTDRSYEELRLEVPEKQQLISDMYRAGYRYFSYDIYVETTAKEGDLPSMPLCLYGSELDQSFNELFSRNGVYIVQDGAVTNRLASNGWMTVVFDLYTIASKNTSAKAAFYFAVNDKLATVYFDNVRYYLDGELLPNGGIPKYETEIEYEKQPDGSIAVVKGSAFVPYYSNNLSIEKANAYITSKVGEKGDAHENAYLFTSTTGGAWNSSALLACSMAESYYDGVTRLRSMGKYLVFDMYVISAEKINFRLNHFSPSAAFDQDSDITAPEYYWIDIIDKQTGEACKTFAKGMWQTVVLYYNDAVYANGWSANLAIGIDNKGGQLLIDNVRFLPEYTAPTEVKQPGARERFTRLVIGGTQGWSNYYMDGNGDYVLEFTHNADRNKYWSETGIKFNVKDYIGSNQYLKFSFKFTSIDPCNQSIYIFNKGVNISASQWAENGVACYDSEGSPCNYDKLQAGQWYDMVIKITDKTGDPGQYYVVFYQPDYAEAKSHPEITACIKNVEFLKTDDRANDWEINSQIVLGGALDVKYFMDGTDQAVKVSHNYNRNEKWGSVGVMFRVKDNIGDNNYLKFSFKFDGLEDPTLEQSMYIFNKGKNISASNWASSGVTCYDKDGNRLAYSDLQAGQWYDLYIKITDKTGDPGQYYVVFYQNDYANAASHPDITAYVKNIGYVAELPAAEEEDPIEKLQSQITLGSNLSSEYLMDGQDATVKVWHNLNHESGSGWGKVGVHFNLANQGSNQYVKFTYKFDAIQGANGTYQQVIYIHNGNNISLYKASGNSVDVIKERGCYIYEAGTATEVDFHNLETGVWYDFYVKVNATGSATDCYILGSQAYYGDASEHPDVYSYMKNVEFVNELPAAEEENPFEELQSQIAPGSNLNSEYLMDGQDAMVKVWHNLNHESGSGWGNVGVHFNLTNQGSNQYVKFTYKVDAIQGANGTYQQIIYIYNGNNISLYKDSGNTVDVIKERGCYIYEAGTATEVDFHNLETGVWYDFYVKVNATGSATDCYILGSQAYYGSAEEHPDVYSYMKNVEFVNELPVAEEEDPFEELQSQITLGSNLSSEYLMDGQDAMVKVWHNLNHESGSGWGNVGVHFNLDNQGSNQYVKFTYKVDAIQGANGTYPQIIYIYNGNNISLYKDSGNTVDVIKERGCYIYEAGTATEVDFHNLEAGVWYDFYVKVNATGSATDCYILGSQAYYGSAEEHPDVYSYMKNVEFVNELPAAVEEDPIEKLQSQITLGSALTSEYYLEGTDAVVKAGHAIGNASGTANIQFNVPANTDGQYIKFMWRIDAIQGESQTYEKLLELTFGSQSKKLVRPQDWSSSYNKEDVEAYGLYVYDPATGESMRTQDMVPGNWYECYIKLEKDADNNVVGSYILAVIQDEYYTFSEHPDVYSYMKNVEFVNTLPAE